MNRNEIAMMRLRGKILVEVNRLYGEDLRRYYRENLAKKVAETRNSGASHVKKETQSRLASINGGEKVANITAV